MEIRQTAQEEEIHNYALFMNKIFSKAAEDALSDAFQVGFESTRDGLENVSFRFVESVLTDMALKRALDDMFDRSIKKWAHSSSFIDVFARRVLSSTHFLRSVAKFICGKVD